jgi:hypothetical protein
MAALLLAGCSQVAAIAPVGGGRAAEGRYAAIDVLVAAGVPVRTAPVCTEDGRRAVTCAGDTMAGDSIRVDSPGDDPDRVTVSVTDVVLYDGSVAAVLQKVLEP